MMKWESSLRAWVSKNVIALGYIAAALIGLFIRYSFQPLVVADIEFMNSSWYNAIKAGGIGAVADPSLQFTYSPFHIYFWWIIAKLMPNADTIAVLKASSTLMELCLAGACFMLCRELLRGSQNKLRRFAAFVLICVNPIFILNGAGWGQTDASFAALCVLAVLLFLKDKPVWALVMTGLALAWKLQAILLLPLFMMLYFCGRKRFSLLWFLLVPAVLIVSGLPMALAGQSPLFAVNIYLGQTDLYTLITYNCPNIFALMGDAVNVKQMVNGMFSRMGLVLCFAALGAVSVWLISRRAVIDGRNTLLLGAWCVLCCIFFLPRMHERYGIVGEALLLCWAVCEMKPRGFVYVLLGILATLSAYAEYMFRHPFFPLQIGGALNLIVLCALTYELVRAFRAGSAAAEVRT